MFVTVAQSAKCKVCSLSRNIFHFDGSMYDEHFFNVSVSSSFFFLYVYFLLLTAVLFSYFFTGIPMLCKLEIWVLELLMRFAPAEICGYFYKKVSTCHLRFTGYFKIGQTRWDCSPINCLEILTPKSAISFNNNYCSKISVSIVFSVKYWKT